MATDQWAITPPSASDLLAAWEWGVPRSVAERGVVLLAALLPGRSTPSLVHLSIGQRDVHLLHARRMLFGPELECVVSCPACSADLELPILVDDLLDRALPPPLSDRNRPSVGTEPTREMEESGWRVRFRLIDSQDLMDAASSQEPTMARDTLLRRCVIAAVAPDGHERTDFPDACLPPEVEVALLEEMERCDVVSPLDFQLDCPECGHGWTAPFDILGFLWAEIEGWAHRTLREVHLLASAYGWRESDILALSAWRREAYLQMSGHG